MAYKLTKTQRKIIRNRNKHAESELVTRGVGKIYSILDRMIINTKVSMGVSRESLTG
jgi:hypothetical protein